MTRTTQFVDAFWEQDFTSVRGSEILSKRMKDGKRVCKEIEEYFKERSKAEQTYAKSLLVISKKLEGREEMGDLGVGLRALKAQTEKIAKTHEEACLDFSKLSKETNSFNENQSKLKHEIEDKLRKSQQDKLSKYRQTMSMKEKYSQKCTENESAEDTYAHCRQNVNTTSKELIKVEKAKEKANDQMNTADIAYRSAVASLETSRRSWEKEMESSCKNFQHLEEERIDFLRDRIWKGTNVDSQTCVEHDEGAEMVRRGLEKCDIAKDIQEFIDRNRLGSQRPAPIVYEAYYRRGSVDNVVIQGNGRGLSPPTRPPQPIPPQVRVPPTRTPDGPLISIDTDSSHLYSSAELEYSYAYADMDQGNRNMRDLSQLTQGCNLPIQKSYTAKTPHELTVMVGDTVEFVRMMKNNMVQIKTADKFGLVPVYCLSPGQATYL